LRLEQPFGNGEVLPDRAGEDEAAAVRPAEHVHHVGEQVSDHGDVVDVHATAAPQGVLPQEVGGSQPHRDDPLPVLVEHRADVQLLTAALAVHHCAGLQDRHAPDRTS